MRHSMDIRSSSLEHTVLFSVRRENAWHLALLDLERRTGAAGQRTGDRRRGPVSSDRTSGLRAIRRARCDAVRSSSGNLDQPPVPLLERIEIHVSAGTLRSRPARERWCTLAGRRADRTLLRVDRDGRAAPLIEARAGYESPRFRRTDDEWPSRLRPKRGATSGSSTSSGPRASDSPGGPAPFRSGRRTDRVSHSSRRPDPGTCSGSRSTAAGRTAASGAPSGAGSGRHKARIPAGHAADAVGGRPAVSRIVVAGWIHARLSRAKAERRT